MNNNPKKTKVLFVITKSNFGGAQKYVLDLAAGLPKDKFEVVVALGGSGILIQKLEAENIRIIHISSLSRDVNPGSDISAFFELLKIFHKENPDVVHLNSAKAGGVGALAARLADVPKIIFTAHGWAFNEERPLWQRFLIKFFSWITLMLSHKTITVSEAIRNDISNWPFISQKISVIKNGINEPDFLAREKARLHLFEKEIINVSKNAFIVGTIAELHKSKGLSYAIEALAKLTPHNLNLYYFILGGGEEKERLEALVELYGLQGRVFLLGFVEDASRYLHAFDLFILPSLTEALGLVLLEAGLAGLPVVASRVGGIPEIIEDGETGILVPSRDPEAIAMAVAKLMETKDLRDKLGSALREKVLQEFSLDHVLIETVALYTNRD